MAGIPLEDLNVLSEETLITPAILKELVPGSPEALATVAAGRTAVKNIIARNDHRIFVVVGPCSIHDPEAALDYAKKLKALAEEVDDTLLLVMRVYFEKPRTTVGWKGLINDPYLDGSFDITQGLKRARKFLIEVNKLGLPAGTEFLDPFTPQYLADLVSWGAIGARTTESQTHRQMASGLSMPIGFKNGTGGSLQIAIDGMVAASSPHAFLGIDIAGNASIIHTKGNSANHLILRGGSKGPNYDESSVSDAVELIEKSGLQPSVVIDCSHANSNKDHKRQPMVLKNVMEQKSKGNKAIIGIMLESHINEGNQGLVNPSSLKYGVSITDACINWSTTEKLILDTQTELAKII